MSAKGSALADLRPAACRLLAAPVVGRHLAVPDHLWFRAVLVLVLGQEQPAVSAKGWVMADPRRVASR